MKKPFYRLGATLINLTFMFSLLCACIPPASAGNLSDNYSQLINQFPGYVDKLKQNGVTDPELRSFVQDLDKALQGKQLTNSNYNETMLNTILEVAKEPQYSNIKPAAVNSLSNQDISQIVSGQVPDDLKNIETAIKDIVPPVSGGGGGGGGGGGSSVLPATISDSVLSAAIQSAGTAGPVTLTTAGDSLNMTIDQLYRVQQTGLSLLVNIHGMQVVLPSAALKLSPPSGAVQFQLTVQQAVYQDVQDLLQPVSGRYKLDGNVFTLSAGTLAGDGSLQSTSQFGGQVTVILPVPTAAQNAAVSGKVGAFRYLGKWTDMAGTYDSVHGTVSFKTQQGGKYALLETVVQPQPQPQPKPQPEQFTDINGHWAQQEINAMAVKGFVSGVGEGKFAPEATITRAEFATILARMAGLTADPDGAVRFSDVPANAWYRGMVGAAVKAGLVSGVSAHQFAPGDLITREQMAAMMVRLMARDGLDMTIDNSGVSEALAPFGDAGGISSWARSSVALMAHWQVMSGRENGKFIPLGNATRAEATVVLYRVLQKLPQ